MSVGNIQENPEETKEKFETAPNLVIDEITGGYGVHVMITNTGDEPAKNLTWQIEINGDYVLLRSGPVPPWPIVDELPAGESIVVDSVVNSFIFGFGDVSITAHAYSEESTAEKTVNGTAYAFLIGID